MHQSAIGETVAIRRFGNRCSSIIKWNLHCMSTRRMHGLSALQALSPAVCKVPTLGLPMTGDEGRPSPPHRYANERIHSLNAYQGLYAVGVTNCNYNVPTSQLWLSSNSTKPSHFAPAYIPWPISSALTSMYTLSYCIWGVLTLATRWFLGYGGMKKKSRRMFTNDDACKVSPKKPTWFFSTTPSVRLDYRPCID